MNSCGGPFDVSIFVDALDHSKYTASSLRSLSRISRLFIRVVVNAA